MPVGLEHLAICGAQILVTAIVAPLGVIAIAANAFAIIAESLCYMPGYGIAEAATTLGGQSIGAGRHSLTKSFGIITVGSGMVVMAALGVVLYIYAPEIISVMSPVEEIRLLGADILRIEAWAEPDVRGGHRGLWLLYRPRTHHTSIGHESHQHMGRQADIGSLACSYHGAARCVVGNVH